MVGVFNILRNRNNRKMTTEEKVDRILTEYNFDRMSFDDAKSQLIELIEEQ